MLVWLEGLVEGDQLVVRLVDANVLPSSEPVLRILCAQQYATNL